MSPTVESPTRVLFGLFEADLQTGELWKAGKRIKIQSQPFKVLTALLERPGEIVTREELQLRVWGKDTIVDFDHSLGTAINKIREALSDTADNPRFVETLARRGYRFIAPVTHPAPAPASPTPVVPPAASAATLSDPAGPDQPEVTPVHAVPITPGGTSPTNARLLNIEAHSSINVGSLRTDSFRRWAIPLACAVVAAALGYSLAPQRVARRSFHINQITHSGRISPGAPAMESLPAIRPPPTASASSPLSSRMAEPPLPRSPSLQARFSRFPCQVRSPLRRSATSPPTAPDCSSAVTCLPESEQALWVVPTGGGSAYRVANILAHDATWMPDGKTILYAIGNELRLTDLNDGTQTTYASLAGRPFWLRWSPDGKLLRFTILDPITHTAALWELAAGSHSPHEILPGWTAARRRVLRHLDRRRQVLRLPIHPRRHHRPLAPERQVHDQPREADRRPPQLSSTRRGPQWPPHLLPWGRHLQSELQRYMPDRKEFVPDRTFPRRRQPRDLLPRQEVGRLDRSARPPMARPRPGYRRKP